MMTTRSTPEPSERQSAGSFQNGTFAKEYATAPPGPRGPQRRTRSAHTTTVASSGGASPRARARSRPGSPAIGPPPGGAGQLPELGTHFTAEEVGDLVAINIKGIGEHGRR